MAILVPDFGEINSLPQKLTEGEKALMDALCKLLDDQWTVYVQPHLNGLRPDIVIFSEDAGVGIFEVKDWDLNNYQIVINDDNKYTWQVFKEEQLHWEECPIKQAEKYCDFIFKHEIPILDAKGIMNKYVYSLIQPFVYFHKHTTHDVKNKLISILGKYSNVFGYDSLKPEILNKILAERYLVHGSKFTNLMREIGLAERLPNALAYPKHGDTTLINLLQPLSNKQQNLLPNTVGGRRVIGVAGSGKTFVLVHKAVNAAREGKKVLLVCFNITMANYLRDLVTRLARHYDPHCHRNIEVGHFHRFFPDEDPNVDQRNMKVPVDVLLIDEGQDFERIWIEKLQKVGASNYHFMFCEDNRQNIFGRNIQEKIQVPGIKGRSNILHESYRIPPQTVKIANYLSTWAKEKGFFEEGLSATVKSIKVIQGDLFIRNIWFDGNEDEAVNAIREDISKLVQDRNTARPDIAILVCNVEDGWRICQVLDELKLPKPQCNFESKEENRKLYERYGHNWESFKEQVKKIRRCYKAAFWMQGGRIKVCTIHSFKGWELSNILIFFNPKEEQQEARVPLLYTAITRSQQCLTIYNIDSDFSQFGSNAVAQDYMQKHPLTNEDITF